MKQRIGHWTGAVALLLGLVSGTQLRADDIVRTSGAAYEGVRITDATWAEIEYRDERISVPQKVNAEEIAEIRWTSEPATLSRGRGNLQNGEFAKAVSAFKSAATLPNELHSDNAKYLLGAAHLAWANQDPSQLPGAVTALEAYIADAKSREHFYVPAAILALSAAHVKAGDFSKAESVLSDIASGAMGRRWVEAAKLAKAEAGLAQEKFPAAREVFREIQGSSNPEYDLRARIGYAACQVGQKQYPGAVSTLKEFLGEDGSRNTDPPRYGDHRARAWIVYGQAEEGAAGGDKEKLQWAVIRYLRAASVGTAGGEAFAEALFRAKEVLMKLGQRDRAEVVSQRLAQLAPNSPWNR